MPHFAKCKFCIYLLYEHFEKWTAGKIAKMTPHGIRKNPQKCSYRRDLGSSQILRDPKMTILAIFAQVPSGDDEQ